MTARDETSRSTSSRGRAARPPVEFTAGAARLLFVWQADRWSHGLTLPAEDRAAAVTPAACGWHSLDGPWPAVGDPRWPASPALVEVSQIEGTVGGVARGGPVILGVGMAGRSHYSASVVRDPLVGDAVRFEIACRLHDGPGWVGSTYRAGRQIVRIEATVLPGGLPRTVVWSYSLGPSGVFGVRGATVSTTHA